MVRLVMPGLLAWIVEMPMLPHRRRAFKAAPRPPYAKWLRGKGFAPGFIFGVGR